MFNFWGRVDAPSVGGKLCAELGFEIARDPELLSLAAESQGNQPPPNMLLAAVQYLLLTRYVAGERDTVKLADCNPHGVWIEWAKS